MYKIKRNITTIPSWPIDTRRPIIVIKKGQLNPPLLDAVPTAPKVSRDILQSWVDDYQARRPNAVAEFNALFVQGEIQ